MRILVVITCLAAACAPAIHSSSSVTQAITTPSACLDPSAFGAIPNDGVDDRPAFQAAIDAKCSVGGGEVCAGAGAFDFTTAPLGSYNRFAALSWHCPNIILRGAGELATVLRVSGDQSGVGPIGIISLDPGASGAAIRDLAFDTSAAFHTGEQFHALEIGSGVGDTATGPPVTNVTVQHVRFNHPGIPGERKGDCIRLLGNNEASEVRNVKLLDLDFVACARSGVNMQRNANAVTISHGYFAADQIGGAPIDGEATGGGWSHGLIVEASTFFRLAPGGESYAIELTSQTNYQITGNTFIGRGLFAYRTTDGVIIGNTFDCTDCTAAGVIELQNQAERITIGPNSLRRRGSVSGDLIHLNPHSGGMPTGITITGNTGRNEVDGACVYAHSITDSVIAVNQCTGSGGPNSIGVFVAALSRQVENVTIIGNTLRGFAFAAVDVGAGPYPVVGSVVTGNVAISSGAMKCPGYTLIPAGGLARLANTWSAGDSCAAH